MASFSELTEEDNGNEGGEELMDSALLSLECLIDEEAVNDPLNLFPDQHSAFLFGEDSTVQDEDERRLVCVSTVAAAAPSTPNPRWSRDTAFASDRDFIKEMDKVITSVIEEAVYLFQLDPREYHPFYLRIYKYIRMGLQQGYSFPGLTLWQTFEEKVKGILNKDGGKKNKTFLGEESPYATYLRIGKVIVNGQEVAISRNAKEVRKKIKEVEKAAREIVEKRRKRLERERGRGGSGSGGNEGDIRNDLKTRLEFFEFAKEITYPADCGEMNRIWKMFLEEFPEDPITKPEAKAKGRKKKVQNAEEIESMPSKNKRQRLSTEGPKDVEEIPIIKTEPEEPPSEEDYFSSSPISSAMRELSPLQFSQEDDLHPSNSKGKETDNCAMERLAEIRKSRMMRRSKATNLIKKKTEVKANSGTKSTLNKLKKSTLSRTANSKLNSTRNLLEKKLCTAGGGILAKNPTKAKTVNPRPPGKPPNLQSKPTTKKIAAKSKISKRTAEAQPKIKKKMTLPESPEETTSFGDASADINEELINLLAIPTEIKKEDDRKGPKMCEECGLVFQNKASLTKHKRAAHNAISSKCPICQEIFSGGRNLWLHFQREHSVDGQLLERDPLPPPNPSAAAATAPPGIMYHPPQEKTVPERLMCLHCGKMFQEKQGLRRHFINIHGDGSKPFSCPHCSKSFKTKDSLQAHVGQVHLGQDHACNVCGRKLQGAGKLWRHKVEVHGMSDLLPPAGVTEMQCEYCGERMLRGMIRHVEKLHPERLEDFRKSKVRQSHSQGGKRYPCSEASRERAVLRKREQRRKFKEEGVGPAWLHKEIRPKGSEETPDIMKTQCPQCGTTLLKTSLRKHLKDMHGTKLNPNAGAWICNKPGCGERFTEKAHLEGHLRSEHFNFSSCLVSIGAVMEKATEDPLLPQWFCVICQNSFQQVDEILIHFILRHEQTLVKVGLNDGENQVMKVISSLGMNCPHCQQSFGNDKELRNHVNEKHSELCWKCPEENCESTLTGPEDLQEHFFLEHMNPIEAPEGGWDNFRKAIKLNPKTEKKESFQKASQVECPECGKYFAETRMLACHWKSSHPEKYEELKCKECSVAKFTERAFLCHLMNNHRDKGYSAEKVNQEKKANLFEYWIVNCELCDKELTVAAYRTHLKNKHGIRQERGKLLQCPCPKSFSKRETWMTHMEELHGGKGIELLKIVSKLNVGEEVNLQKLKIVCGRKGKEAARRRRSGVTAEALCTNCVCSVCFKPFGSGSLMAEHFKKDHPKESEAFKCGECGIQRFSERGHLHHMMNTHSLKGYHKGDLAPEKLDLLFRLWRLNCQICGNEMSLAGYAPHLKSVHDIGEDNGEKFRCPCPKNWKNRPIWMIHMEEIHGGEAEELFKMVKEVNCGGEVDLAAIRDDDDNRIAKKVKKSKSGTKAKGNLKRKVRKVILSDSDDDSSAGSSGKKMENVKKTTRKQSRGKGNPKSGNFLPVVKVEKDVEPCNVLS